MATAAASSSTMDPAKVEALKAYRDVSARTGTELHGTARRQLTPQQKVKEHSRMAENLKKSTLTSSYPCS